MGRPARYTRGGMAFSRVGKTVLEWLGGVEGVDAVPDDGHAFVERIHTLVATPARAQAGRA